MTYRLLIDGALVAGAAELEVVNPATGKLLATAPRADAAQAEQAIAAGKSAFPAWGRQSFAQRGALLERFADAIEAQVDAFARLLTQEQGKPLRQAKGEVLACIAAFRYYATQVLEPKVLRESEKERIVEQRYPLGVVAAIAPWNFPLLMITLKVAPALITGNCVIAKPAPTTPLTALLLGEVAAEVFPAGVFQTLVDQNDIGALLGSHPDVGFVSFTGSTATGKKVLAGAADTLKRFTLELGGNDAAIVLDDAEPAAIARAIFWGAFTNCGQICAGIKRLYVPDALFGGMVDALAQLAKRVRVGPASDELSQIGPAQGASKPSLGFRASTANARTPASSDTELVDALVR